MKKNVNILFFLWLMSLPSFAQTGRISDAINFLQAGEVDSAKTAIDAAIKDPETSKDATAWYIKGYVYRDLYKKYEGATRGVSYRKEAVNAFKKSMELDTSAHNKNENLKNIRNLAYSYFNDAAGLLTAEHYSNSIEFYNLYKETIVVSDPNANHVKKDVEFKLALASLYNSIYENDRKKNEVYYNKTKDLYTDVLKVDPNNVNANYNLGILYYNQAVNIIKEMDYDVDIFELSNTQDNTIVLFKESLPYMEKAYTLDPQKKETVIGLSGIYFSLNEEEKSKAFRQILEGLEKK